MPLNQEKFDSALMQYRINKSKAFFHHSRWLLPLLYISFWLIDCIYAPEQKWTFLALRVAFVPAVTLIYFLSTKATTLKKLRLYGILYATMAASIINLMIFLSEDPYSIYYAGLNLVALCSFLFISLSKRDFVIIAGTIFLPYLAIEVSEITQGKDIVSVIVNSSFIIGTLVIGVLSNIISRVLEAKYIESNCLLEEEVAQRGNIIKKKTREGLVLERLSAQFSPQIIQAIKNGERKISNTRQRSEICAIFIDVVNSTGRLLRLDHEAFVESIETFMEITINTLLKYDLTIDKFYGDGVLAFSNDPVKRVDFVERTCQAALEIKQQILIEQANLRRKWKRPFEITIGISKGFASVGFYGNTTYIKQYSAIGSCLAQSQRLSSLAEPNEILFDQEIYEIIASKGFNCEKKGDFNLKGFGDDLFEVFNLTSLSTEQAMNYFNVACKKCEQNSVYIDEQDGIYVLKCRKCGHTENQNELQKIEKKSA